MRRLLLVTSLVLIVSSVLSQQVVSDTIPSDSVKRKTFVSRFFNEDPLKKHNHIVDLELVNFRFNTIGYNYLFSVTPKWRIGGRVNLWYYKSDSDIPSYMTKYGMLYGFDFLTDFRIWRTIRMEGTVAIIGLISHPSKTNTLDTKTSFENPYLHVKLGVNYTIVKHLFLRTGLVLYFDHKSNDWRPGFNASVGYKF